MHPTKRSIKRHIIRHSLLITSLCVLGVTVVSCLYVFGYQIKEATNTLSAVQNAQSAVINTYVTTITNHAQTVATQITPYIQSGSITAPGTIDAVVYRAQQNQPAFIQLTLLKDGVITYGNTNSYIPAENDSISIGTSSEGNLETYTIWQAIAGQDNIRVGIDYNMQPLLTQLFGAQEGRRFPVSSTLLLPVNNDFWQVELVADKLLQTSYASQTSVTKLTSELDFWRLLTKQANTATLAYTDSTNNWQIQTSISSQVLEILPMQLARHLLLVTVLLCILAAVLAKLLAHKLIAPMRLIQTKINDYNKTQKEYHAEEHSSYELNVLDANIEHITEKLSTHLVSIQQSKEAITSSAKEQYNTDHTLFNAISIGLATVTTEGKIIEANDALLKILHVPHSHVHTLPIWSFLKLRQKGVDCTKELHPAFLALSTGKEIRIQPDEHVAAQTSDGNWIPVRIIATPIKERGEIKGVIIIVQDAQAEYKVETLKSEFLGLASHQLRTPIAAIQWYSELLSDPETSNLSNEQKGLMVELRLAVQRLSNIVTEMLDANRLHNGEILPQPTEFNFISLLHGIANDAKSITKQQDVQINILHAEPFITVLSDPILVGIVLQNVLSNAIKYSPQNGIVRVRIEQNATNIICHVSDDGIGVPQADQARIFQKLYRAKNAIKADPTGSGLGLYACKKIVKKLGGSLSFSSIENKGSTFTMCIPKHYQSSLPEGV